MYAVYMNKSYAPANVLTDYRRLVRPSAKSAMIVKTKRSDLGSYT